MNRSILISLILSIFIYAQDNTTALDTTNISDPGRDKESMSKYDDPNIFPVKESPINTQVITAGFTATGSVHRERIPGIKNLGVG